MHKGTGANRVPPKEHGCDEKGDVFDVVDDFITQRGIVHLAIMPDPGDSDQCKPGEEGRCQFAQYSPELGRLRQQAAHARAQGSRQSPHHKGIGIAQPQQGGDDHDDQQVLDHVHREQQGGVGVQAGKQGDNQENQSGQIGEQSPGFDKLFLLVLDCPGAAIAAGNLIQLQPAAHVENPEEQGNDQYFGAEFPGGEDGCQEVGHGSDDG